MTSIERAPFHIKGIDEIPIEERFLVRFVDHAEVPLEGCKFDFEELSKAIKTEQEKLGKGKNLSANVFLASYAFSLLKIRNVENPDEEAEEKLCAEAYPKLMEIYKDEKGKIEGTRAAYLIANQLLNGKKYVDAFHYFKQTAVENYPFAEFGMAFVYSKIEIDLAHRKRVGIADMETEQLSNFVEKVNLDIEKRYELYKKAAKKGIYLAIDIIKRVESGQRNA